MVPLLVDERYSAQATRVLSDDPAVATWWGSRVECVSALRRLERDGGIGRAEITASLSLLDSVSAGWFELLPSDELRAVAERTLAVHSLRAADALQLAAALTWRGTAAAAAEFVSLDERLRDAATREGFTPLPVAL